jgi:hypothetical protein
VTDVDGLPGDAIDLGHDTFYTKVMREGEWVAIHEWHRCRSGEYGAGFIAFTERVKPDWWAGGPTWELISTDPLTLSPSLACQNCPHHGFIREGKWVPA